MTTDNQITAAKGRGFRRKRGVKNEIVRGVRNRAQLSVGVETQPKEWPV